METGRKGKAAQKAYGKGAAMKVMAQRHRIAGFAAVVETGRKGNGTKGRWDEGAMGRKDKAVQKAYGKGAAMKAMPQRHRITEFAAVVGTGRKGNGTKGRWDGRTRPYRRSMERMLR